MSVYRKDFDKTKSITFLIKDEKLSEQYNEIWKISATLSKQNFTGNMYIMKNI